MFKSKYFELIIDFDTIFSIFINNETKSTVTAKVTKDGAHVFYRAAIRSRSPRIAAEDIAVSLEVREAPRPRWFNQFWPAQQDDQPSRVTAIG